MKNILEYYYHFKIEKLYQVKKQYVFYIEQHQYLFVPYTRSIEEAQDLYVLNLEMINMHAFYHRIVLNKDRQILTMVSQKPYILLEVVVPTNHFITLQQFSYPLVVLPHQWKLFPSLIRFDWITLWKEKIDYFEYQIEHFRKKYPLLVQSISYFIGLGENAISYIQNTLIEEKQSSSSLVVSHKRVWAQEMELEFYNPLNVVIDHQVRDVAEYLKSSFYHDDYKLEEFDAFLQSMHFSKFDLRLLYGRLLFPSFYFDLYDEIINGYKREENILQVTSRILEYERFLYDIYMILQKYSSLPPVTWITKHFSF